MEQVLLVTGGSRGIGAATALLAAAQGFAVAVNYTAHPEAAQNVVQRIEAEGGKAFAVQADVSREDQVLAMFAAIDSKLGRLTALVNNAGVVDTTARVDEMSAQRLERMFGINVIGSILCAREAILRMSTRHGGAGGAIVNVSSAASRLGSPGQYVDYAAAKGAIDAFTLGLAREVAAEGIRVNAVRPGLIETDIHASGGLPNRVRDLAHLVPMQRGGSAEEVAQAIVWLLSPQASYTTMSLIDVSGRPLMGSPRYCWEDMPVGFTRDLGTVTPTAREIKEFAEQFDPQPFHIDEAAGRRSIFGNLCASGWHTCALAMKLTVENFLLESSSMGSPGLENLRWLKPVYPGDTLRLHYTIIESRPMRRRADTGLVRASWEMFNQNDEKVLQMDGYGMFGRRHPATPEELAALGPSTDKG